MRSSNSATSPGSGHSSCWGDHVERLSGLAELLPPALGALPPTGVESDDTPEDATANVVEARARWLADDARALPVTVAP